VARALGRGVRDLGDLHATTAIEEGAGRTELVGWPTPHTLLLAAGAGRNNAAKVAALLGAGPKARDNKPLVTVLERLPAHAIASGGRSARTRSSAASAPADGASRIAGDSDVELTTAAGATRTIESLEKGSASCCPGSVSTTSRPGSASGTAAPTRASTSS
jgi:hypothetical protein